MLWPVPRPPCLPSPRRWTAPGSWLLGGTIAAASASPAIAAPATTEPAPAATPTPTPTPAPTDAPTSAPAPTPTAAPAATAAPSTPAPPADPAPAPTTTPEGPTNAPAAATSPEPTPVAAPVRPPRVDGTYLGGVLGFAESFARVNNFPTPNPFSGTSGGLRFGQAILPWLTIGMQITGTLGYRAADPRQRLLQGAALVDFGFLPVPRIPLSLRVGFGAGGGGVREDGVAARSGFGGAVFTGAVRYEFFPLAARKRPKRGGGFALGPEIGWIGFTPAAKGRPMSNTVYLGLFMGFYFGS